MRGDTFMAIALLAIDERFWRVHRVFFSIDRGDRRHIGLGGDGTFACAFSGRRYELALPLSLRASAMAFTNRAPGLTLRTAGDLCRPTPAESRGCSSRISCMIGSLGDLCVALATTERHL